MSPAGPACRSFPAYSPAYCAAVSIRLYNSVFISILPLLKVCPFTKEASSDAKKHHIAISSAFAIVPCRGKKPFLLHFPVPFDPFRIGQTWRDAFTRIPYWLSLTLPSRLSPQPCWFRMQISRPDIKRRDRRHVNNASGFLPHHFSDKLRQLHRRKYINIKYLPEFCIRSLKTIRLQSRIINQDIFFLPISAPALLPLFSCLQSK